MAKELMNPVDLTLRWMGDKERALINASPVTPGETKKMMAVYSAQIRSAALRECTSKSLVHCAYVVVGLGLNSLPQLGHVYIVRFGNEAVIIVGYKGFMHMARRSKLVTAICPALHYQNDQLDYRAGLNPKLDHVPWHVLGREDSGIITGGHVVATFANGQMQPYVCGAKEFENARKRSRASSKGPWVTDLAAMQLKTVIRRASTWWPQDEVFSRAIAVDEAADRGEPQVTRENLYADGITDIEPEDPMELPEKT